MDSTNQRREVWLKVTPELDVRLLIITVNEGIVLVTEESVASVLGIDKSGKSADPYPVTYPVVEELLGYNGYRLWGEM
jgi:hypothetical protein